MIWIGILATAAGCYALKLTGLSVPDRLLTHAATQRVAGLIPPALLGALIAVQVLADGQRLVLDARLAGLGAAVLLLVLRAPFLVVVVGAAATAALLRAL
ncbi:AzlD domain-containing protein [Nocardioides maradonensis]